MLPLPAVIEIDCSVAAVTLSAIELEVIPFSVAEMLLEPTAAPAARPLGLIVTAAVLDELHTAERVRFWVLPSLKVPVAVNWSLVPLAIVPLAAFTVIDWRVAAAAVTMSVMVLEVIPFCVADMLLDPMATPFARPPLLTVAAAVLDELQVADPVRFCVLPSLNVPMAVN